MAVTYLPGIAAPVSKHLATVIVVDVETVANYCAAAEVVIHVKNIGKKRLG